MDKMQRQTDKDLEELEKRLKKEYKKAEKEVEERAIAYFNEFQERDKIMLQKLRDGVITESEYKQWRMGRMMSGNRWVALRDNLARDYVMTNQRSAGMINDSLFQTYANNYNYQIYLAERNGRIDTGFALYDKDAVIHALQETPDLIATAQVNIPKNMRWNEQKITSAIAQGILQGDSISNIANRLQSVKNMNQSSAIRNARTLTTGAENGGRFNCSKRLEAAGVEQQKQWMATLDKRTRDSHRALDEEMADMDQPFSNGLMYPGDPNMAHIKPEEVYNCRCRYVTQFKRWPSTFTRSTEALGESYEDWKNGRRRV